MDDFDFRAVNGFGADGGDANAADLPKFSRQRKPAFSADDILKRLEAMKAERAKWEPMWDKAAEMCSVDSGLFSTDERGRVRQTVFDTTGRNALSCFCSSMKSVIVPTTSRWHRLKAAEVWTWHQGGSLRMTLGGTGPTPEAGTTLALGPRLGAGEEFQILAPPDQWQTTRLVDGDFALVSCVVCPAFDDADCLLPPEPLPNEIYE